MTTLERTLRYVVIGGVFVLPFVCLYVSSALFFPYITGKNIAFRLIVEVITAAWLALALIDVRYRPRRSWILAALSLFVLVMAVADAQGVNVGKSFWSNFERMDGWVTLAHLFLYVVVATSVLRTEKLWKWLWWTSLGVSVYLSLYGLLQIAGVTALGQGGSAGLSARIDATFGNPIYFAVYMLFHVFLAAMLWSQSWRERRTGERLAPSLAYGAIIALDALALLLTGTRGTTLGLIGGALLSVLIYALIQGSRAIRTAAVTSVLVVVVLAASLVAARDTSFVKEVGFLDRLASISTTDATVKARFINWSIAWQGVQERPILGWGQENYAIVFDKYYDPRMYAQEPWFDRVHNIVFDWLVAGGILGLLSYLSIFAAILWVLWRKEGFTALERSILTGLVAGYFVHNLFVFDNVTSYILFGALLAFLMYRSSEGDNDAPVWSADIFPKGALPYATLGAVLLLWLGAWWVNAGALSSNRMILQGIQPQPSFEDNISLMQGAAEYGWPGVQEAREQLVQISGQIASASSIGPDVKQKFLTAAASGMEAQEKLSPLDARFPLFLGTLYNQYGDYAKAQSALERALELSPKKQSILYSLGQNTWGLNENVRALGYFKQAYELDTTNEEALVWYAAAAIRAGQSSLASQLADELGRVSANPAQSYLTLAATYYRTGAHNDAIQILMRAKQADPTLASQIDELIASIRAGKQL